jgi:hypothetical protein
VLVTLYMSCENTKEKGCYMSFEGASTGAAGITHAAADADSVGGVFTLPTAPISQSGSFVFTAAGTGTVTFTAKYRVIEKEATVLSSSITAQVFE